MSCLKNITRSIFLTVVVVGFIAFGGQNWIKESINNFLHPTHDVIMERAQKVGDFSKIDKEFEIEKAAGLMGYNAVIAEHKASGQKMVVVDTSKKAIISQADYITEKGTMTSYGQEIPYVKFRAKLKKLPIGEISGIISVVEDEKGNDKILVSANQGEKYSQLISNEFFKVIK